MKRFNMIIKREEQTKKSSSSPSSFCDGEQGNSTEKKIKSKEKIELTISIDYVNNWGINEALRELFQNSIDRKKIESESSMIIKYYKKKNIILIGNEKTSLLKKTLILGNTSKNSDSSQIGQYGEGYKLALIVLLRNNYQVIIRSGNEIWMPSIEYSKKFECEILSINIDYIISNNNDLVFMIKNITMDDYLNYKNYNLHLQKPVKKDITSTGEILLEEQHRGKIYVEGLYVCSTPENEKFWYGYNFYAGVMELDRDRNKLSSFDITWQTEQMFKELTPDDDERIIEMLEDEAKDLEYFAYKSHNNFEAIERIGDRCYKKFKENYGNDVFPVATEDKNQELHIIYEGIKTKFVPKGVYEACNASFLLKDDLLKLKGRIFKSPTAILKDFMNNYKSYFSQILLEKFNDELIKKSSEWSGGSYEKDIL